MTILHVRSAPQFADYLRSVLADAHGSPTAWTSPWGTLICLALPG